MNIENLDTEELNTLKLEIEAELKARTEVVWKPVQGEEYYYIEDEVTVHCVKYDKMWTDHRRIAGGNYYQTKQEAEDRVEYLKLYEEMKRMTKGFKPEFNKPSYYIGFSRYSKDWVANYSSSGDKVTRLPQFATQKDAMEAIVAIGESRLSRVILGAKRHG